MNRYGEMALHHWRRHRPRALAAMAHPTTHFTRLGDEVETRVGSLRDQILGAPRPGETAESYRLRSYQARRQATEVVLGELVWVEPEAGSEPEPWQDEADPELAAYYARLDLVAQTLSSEPAAWTDTAPEVVGRT